MKKGNLPGRESLLGNSRIEIPIAAPADVGAVIRRRRRDLNLTQADAAALCRVGTRFLSDLENGKATMQLGKALSVLRAFGLLVLIRKKV